MEWLREILSVNDGRGFKLANARVPLKALGPDVRPAPNSEGFCDVDIEIEAGTIKSIYPCRAVVDDAGRTFDLSHRCLWPTFADLHTHLDKTECIARLPPREISLKDAVLRTMEEKQIWTQSDITQRAEFALKCAWVHGTSCLRTHVDMFGLGSADGWEVIRDLQEQWSEIVDLQMVAMVPIEFYLGTGARRLVERVAQDGGILGGVTKVRQATNRKDADRRLKESLRMLFAFATEYNLDVDLHVDESVDPEDNSLARVAQLAREYGIGERVVCGHCCSLSMHDESVRNATLQTCKDAGLTIVSLPLVNLFLQDRRVGRVPLWRGLPPLQEIRRCKIPVALASDNCRDAFYSYGDYDLMELLRISMLAGHLDGYGEEWVSSVTLTPAQTMGRKRKHQLVIGGSADFIIFDARCLDEAFARPQSDRIVVRDGEVISNKLPSFRELVGS